MLYASSQFIEWIIIAQYKVYKTKTNVAFRNASNLGSFWNINRVVNAMLYLHSNVIQMFFLFSDLQIFFESIFF